MENFDVIINKSKKETADAHLNEMITITNTQKINELYLDIHKDLQKLFDETSTIEINDVHYKKKLNNINQVFDYFLLSSVLK